MENRPLVSVIIPTYNRQKYIALAISSVLEQTYKNIEIIVIDDFSNDKSLEIISEIVKENGNIYLYKNEKNLGFVKSLNKGVSLAKGKYIARLDDDDVWCDVRKLEKQVDFLEKHKDYVLVGGGVIKINKDGSEMVRFSVPEEDKDIRKVILVNNVFAHSAVIFKRDDFMKVGGYDEQFGFFADWALWLALGKIGKFYNFQEFFIHYLDQEDNRLNSTRDRQIRRRLLAKVKLNNKYKRYYNGSIKAILHSFASYVYSFIPLRKKLWPIIFKIRSFFFGHPPYKYF